MFPFYCNKNTQFICHALLEQDILHGYCIQQGCLGKWVYSDKWKIVYKNNKKCYICGYLLAYHAAMSQWQWTVFYNNWFFGTFNCTACCGSYMRCLHCIALPWLVHVVSKELQTELTMKFWISMEMRFSFNI